LGPDQKGASRTATTNLVLNKVSLEQGECRNHRCGEGLAKPNPLTVYEWAKNHKVPNAFDMGPLNWERCLYDLGHPGGKFHELEYDQQGKLKYK
jgi:hypothetical protein